MNNDLPEGYEYVDPKLIPNHELAPECDLKTTPEGKLIARLGTTAMYSTPLPEVRCLCGYGPGLACSNHCPAHPRNARVKVLPQLLAGLPEKPEGLMWAAMDGARWIRFDFDWPFTLTKTSAYAFALPRHVLDAIEAGKEVNWSAEDPEKYPPIPLLSTHPTEPSQASGPTDGEMLDWLEKADVFRVVNYADGWVVMMEDGQDYDCPTLRAAIQSAMRKETK